jgi:rusticyanin
VVGVSKLATTVRRKSAVSTLLVIGIVVILVAAGAASVYFVGSYLHNNNSEITGSSTSSSTSQVSIEALSLNPSTSNLSSTVNVNSQSPIVRMDLYINGTFIGSCNYTWSGSTVAGNYGLGLTTRSWNNGTYSMMFSVFPKYFPMMSGVRMMSGGTYMIRMVAYFQDGANYTTSTAIYPDQYGNYGMMGSYYNNGNFSNYLGSFMAGMMGRFYSIQTTSISQVIGAMNQIPGNAKVFSSNDTIVFSGTQNVTLLVFGMMPDRATNLTGMNPPIYAKDDVFVIYGLVDPTLVIPNGARVNLIFANLDDDMYHNFVVTSLSPPYYYMPMQGLMFSNSSSWYIGGMMGGGGGMMGGGYNSNTIFGTMMPFLSPADYSQGSAYYYVTSFNLSSYGGNYWYVCTYPGHAQSGMYGRILVRG